MSGNSSGFQFHPNSPTHDPGRICIKYHEQIYGRVVKRTISNTGDFTTAALELLNNTAVAQFIIFSLFIFILKNGCGVLNGVFSLFSAVLFLGVSGFYF